MTWLQRYRFRHYYRRSMWILPVLGMVAALVAVRLTHAVESAMGWTSQVDPTTAVAFLGTLAASMFTFVVFVSSALLVTVQLASAQLTPRLLGLVFQNASTKRSLAFFVFSFTFTLTALIRVSTSVPLMTAHMAAYCSLLSLAVFLYLVDRVCSMLRPSGALAMAARLGREVIKTVYPRRLVEMQGKLPEPELASTGELRRTVPNLREGVVLAFDMPGLVALAQRADCVIELVPQVGDFVAADQPLFRIYGEGDVPDSALYESVAVGPERTMQQDPTLALRIMVDIASKGLSPAINDPTTAVLAIDQIQYLLRHIGARYLDEGQVYDSQGVVRLLYRTPDWEDFVALAVTEIRHFGGTSIQVARRLRALLLDLIQSVPPERTEVLRLELKLLERSARRSFLEDEDRAMAEISDSLGVGGHAARTDRNGHEASKS